MLATGWRGGVSPSPRRNAYGHAQGNHKTMPYAPAVRLPIRTSAPPRGFTDNPRSPQPGGSGGSPLAPTNSGHAPDHPPVPDTGGSGGSPPGLAQRAGLRRS